MKQQSFSLGYQIKNESFIVILLFVKLLLLYPLEVKKYSYCLNYVTFIILISIF